MTIILNTTKPFVVYNRCPWHDYHQHVQITNCMVLFSIIFKYMSYSPIQTKNINCSIDIEFCVETMELCLLITWMRK